MREIGFAFMVGALHLRLHLPGCGSLKDKRHVIRGINQRVRQKFGVAVAEVGNLDRPAFCELEIAAVANERAHLHRVLTAVSRVYEGRPDLEVIEVDMDI
jgi:uncharacterized protein YlxP (DUF503 family)